MREWAAVTNAPICLERDERRRPLPFVTKRLRYELRILCCVVHLKTFNVIIYSWPVSKIFGGQLDLVHWLPLLYRTTTYLVAGIPYLYTQYGYFQIDTVTFPPLKNLFHRLHPRTSSVPRKRGFHLKHTA